PVDYGKRSSRASPLGWMLRGGQDCWILSRRYGRGSPCRSIPNRFKRMALIYCSLNDHCRLHLTFATVSITRRTSGIVSWGASSSHNGQHSSAFNANPTLHFAACVSIVRNSFGCELRAATSLTFNLSQYWPTSLSDSIVLSVDMREQSLTQTSRI